MKKTINLLKLINQNFKEKILENYNISIFKTRGKQSLHNDVMKRTKSFRCDGTVFTKIL